MAKRGQTIRKSPAARKRSSAGQRASAPKRTKAGIDKSEEVAALKREVSEARERQKAASDILNVISRSTFELQPVLDTIVRTASRLCDAEFAIIFKRDDDKYHLAATNNAATDFVKYASTHPIPPGRGTITGRTALLQKTVHLPDCLADPEYDAVEYQKAGRYRTMLGVPLRREGAPIGVITLMRAVVKPFTEEQIDLVTTFANQAVIAIENARLLNETKESLEQQTATTEVLQVINASPGDLKPVFDAMLDKAMRLCEASFGGLGPSLMTNWPDGLLRVAFRGRLTNGWQTTNSACLRCSARRFGTDLSFTFST
jgi:two-component system, NtrC family, sensor kinase